MLVEGRDEQIVSLALCQFNSGPVPDIDNQNLSLSTIFSHCQVLLSHCCEHGAN